MLGLLKRSCFEVTNSQDRRTLYLTLVKSSHIVVTFGILVVTFGIWYSRCSEKSNIVYA